MRTAATVVALAVSGCAQPAPAPPTRPDGATPAPFPSTTASDPVPVATNGPASSETATAAAAPAPAPIDPCAAAEPRPAVEQKSLRGFDVGRDGRLYWAVGSDPTAIYSLDATTVTGEPKLELKTDGFKDYASEMVAGREGFWLAASSLYSAAVCGDKMTWIPRGGGRPVVLGGPSCLDGPRPARGGVDVVWATSPNIGGTLRFFLGMGPASLASVSAIPGVIATDLEAVVHEADALYVGKENTLFRKGHGEEPQTLSIFYGGEIASLDLREGHVFAVVREDYRRYIVFDVPPDGKRKELTRIETRASTARIRVGEGFAALAIHGSGDDQASKLVLIDTSGQCPPRELPPMKLASSTLRVHGRHLFVERETGIDVVRWGPPTP
ncbi:MAG: hypothetical protein KC731_21335 [Myxococcales bacterium]|nr:hypothetical protein [Myxococcales bacterium]